MSDAPRVSFSGNPTDEEAAAIVAAIELTWPRPSGVVPVPDTPAWRFSGRWWKTAPRSWPHQAFPSRRRPV